MPTPSPGCSATPRVEASDRLNTGFIVPSVFDPEVAGAVAGAVRAACV